MKHRIWIAAAVATMLATGAQAGAIIGDTAAVQPKPTSASPAGHHNATGKAAQKAAKQADKAAKRAAKAEKRAAKRLARQCRKERKRLAKKGIPLSSACAPASMVMVEAKVADPASGDFLAGNAFGQTGTSNQQGMQGNGNAYGFGHGGGPSNSSLNIVTSDLPLTAYQPSSGPVAQWTPTMVGDAVTVPEPGTLPLLAIGLLGFGAAGRRRTSARN